MAGLRKGGREGEVGHNRENKGAKISALFGGWSRVRSKKEEDESGECVCVGFEGDKKSGWLLGGKRKKSGDSFLAG